MNTLHQVVSFVGGLGKTRCGLLSEHVTANPDEVTCKRCAQGRKPSRRKCSSEGCPCILDIRMVMLRARGVNKWLGQPVAMCIECRNKLKGSWRYAKKLPVTY